jgi:hypothetical protein
VGGGMFKIVKDTGREGKYKVQYNLPTDLLNPLYVICNLEWEDVSNYLRHLEMDKEDLTWVYDLVRLSNKQVTIPEKGDWSVL